jgi:hypothetical protein
MVTILSERGAPTPVVWTRVQPPTSLMAAVASTEVDAVARADALWADYGDEINPDSAREKLAAKMAASSADEPAPKPRRAGGTRASAKRTATKKKTKTKNASDGGTVTDFLQSREGRATVNNVVRGAFGVLKGFMK